MRSHYTLLLPLLVVLLTQCRKDERFTDDPGARLEFSSDTVLFDTVFTTVATVTKRFKVYNRNKEAVRISNIGIEGGQASPFRINVDGAAGNDHENIEILGGDSIFIFVEATLDQSNTNNPFIFEDHIVFNTNGNVQDVLLLAWGQDAHFFYADTAIQGLPPFSIIAGGGLCENVIWTNDKPYVIYGYARVDSCSSLTIEPGVRIYIHGGGGLWIDWYGQITAQGTVDDKIIIQGDRLEPFYDDVPGQWDRIWINEGAAGVDNTFEHVEIKNSLIGIQCESIFTPGQPISENRLILKNVSIRNSSAAGILSRNYPISAENLLIADAGQIGALLTGGGDYQFDHFTIANYWAFDIRNTPSFFLSNRFADIFGATQVRPIGNSTFINGIIYGANTEEFELDLDAAESTDITFDHMLFRTEQALTGDEFPDQTSIYKNTDPGFIDANEGNYDLQNNAYAAGKATSSTVFEDIEGVFYGDDELGCYATEP